MLFRSDRLFALWDYREDFQQVLLRSSMDSGYPENIDVAFIGVSHISVPAYFRGLVIELEDLFDRGTVFSPALVGVTDRKFLFRGGVEGFVVATRMCVRTNRLSYSESSLDNAREDPEPGWNGDLILEV